MFLCGNCNGDEKEPQMAISNVPLPVQFMSAITKKSKRSKKDASVQLKKCRYDQFVEECNQKKIPFFDKEFPPDEKSLNFSVEGRKITWKRITEIIPNCVMVEDEFSPQDIQQGNIGDCYFLSSIAALAQDQERIANIFHNNFKISMLGIYKLIVVKGGIPTEIVIDDYIPVFDSTNRPVFCKATGRQIWVILLEKAWAKMKGSYGQISAGCPHQVLQTFSVAPCYYYQIQQQQNQKYKNMVWDQLTDAADELMPVVAGTKTHVKLPGLEPSHAYTVLDSENVTSYGKVQRLVRLRNPWGKTEYTGFASQNDKDFWAGVQPNIKQQMCPDVGKNDGDFTMPFELFLQNFESIDISDCIFGFSYEFQKLHMYKGQPLFVQFDIKQQHEAFITIERQFSKKDNNQKVLTTNFGYTRVIIAHQPNQDTFQYYDGKLETDFPDLTTYVTFKPGRYIMYIEIQDNNLDVDFQATFSYYFDTLEVKENKTIQILQGKQFHDFLENVFRNHAIRLNNQQAKIGPKPLDWVKTGFMYDEGGFGYVLVNLQPDTSIKVAIKIDREKIRENGFDVLTNCAEEEIVSPGEDRIFLLSCILDGRSTDDIIFPPPGFKVSRLA